MCLNKEQCNGCTGKNISPTTGDFLCYRYSLKATKNKCSKCHELVRETSLIDKMCVSCYVRAVEQEF